MSKIGLIFSGFMVAFFIPVLWFYPFISLQPFFWAYTMRVL